MAKLDNFGYIKKKGLGFQLKVEPFSFQLKMG
jgi:hypothetical protein